MNHFQPPMIVTNYGFAGRTRAGRGVKTEHQRASYYDYVRRHGILMRLQISRVLLHSLSFLGFLPMPLAFMFGMAMIMIA